MKIFISLFLLMYSLNLNAQVAFEWGPSNGGTSKNIYPHAFIGKDDKNVYLLKNTTGMSETSHIIEKYDAASLELKYSAKITTRFQKALLLNKRLYLLNVESKKGTTYIFANEVNPNGDLQRERIDIMQTPDKDLLYETTLMNVRNDDYYSFNTFYVSESQNKNSAFVFPKMIYNNQLVYKVIDKHFSITEKSVTVDLGVNSVINGLDCIFSDDKNIVLLVKTPLPKKEGFKNPGRNRTLAYNYFYVNISIESGKATVSPFNLENGKTITSAYLLSAGDTFIITGFYNSDKKEELETSGIFCCRIKSQTGEKESELNFDYDEKMLVAFKEPLDNEKTAIKKKTAIAAMVRNVFPKNDGGIYLVLEKNYICTNAGYNNGAATDVVVLNLDNKLVLKTKTIVPKIQSSDIQNSGKYNSFYAILKNGTLSLFYNDHIENQGTQERINLKTFGQGGGTYLAIAKINENGTWTKDVLLNYDSETVFIMPKFFVLGSSKEAYLFGERGDHFKLVKIKY